MHAVVNKRNFVCGLNCNNSYSLSPKRVLKNGRQSKLVLLLLSSCFRFIMVLNDCSATGFLTLVIYYHTFVSFADKFCDSKILENEPLRALEQHILRSQTFDIITKAIFADGMDEFIH